MICFQKKFALCSCSIHILIIILMKQQGQLISIYIDYNIELIINMSYLLAYTLIINAVFDQYLEGMELAKAIVSQPLLYHVCGTLESL